MILEPVIPISILATMLVVLVVAFVFCLFGRNYRKSSNFIRLGILALILAALARPVLPTGGETSAMSSNTVLFFIIDSTGSMATEDSNGGMRIEQLRKDVVKIINSFDAPKVSIYAQDVTTYRMMPVSSDVASALRMAENIQIRNTSSSEGTNLNKLLNSAADYINKYHERNQNAKIITFFMSDGDDNVANSHDNITINGNDFKFVNYGAVVGYGTAEGGQVPNVKYVSGEYGIDEYIIKPKGNEYIVVDGKNVTSSINENRLREVANTYSFSYSKSSDIEQIISDAKKHADNTVDINGTTNNNSAFETYWIFMLAAGSLMLIEFFKDFNSFLSEHEVKK